MTLPPEILVLAQPQPTGEVPGVLEARHVGPGLADNGQGCGHVDAVNSGKVHAANSDNREPP
jgi:hypothetical protein